ncbi:hypothetical protein [Mesorhizobium sp.]|uniref:hypothetical protein n=1 Tax=Mesorhizobium sp. TaxID=1871066 RepID=UPI00120E3BB7|nr:hypothetical protein [Mesorhizobium sp.]TIS49172.1 MAG: hypothetical protein E5W96_15665 [Mesorhizobium sp.]
MIFGTPASIDAAGLFKLPLPMQAEGVRLLFEIGRTVAHVSAPLGLSTRQMRALAESEDVFSRGGDGIGQDFQ